MAGVDVGFILAVAVLGWGLSLVTYRPLALRLGWPMGAWQHTRPGRTLAVGAASMALAALYALARAYAGYGTSAMAIMVLGLAWAVFWTGFLRVGAQSALLLAPGAALLLLVRWLA